jgi:ATP-dependent Clp protease ATP-binding subunit ClpX
MKIDLRTKIKTMVLKPKLLEFLKWFGIDIYRALKYGRNFTEFGLTLYCGRQGGGKSISIVEYLERMRIKFPKVKIITNFGYVHEDLSMSDWRDLLHVRNGLDGVIFAIDEIQNEYNSNDWKDFPEDLLREVTQQRKQRIKIVASSQVFTRVVKQLREQCFEAVECRTLAGRWTFQRCFDAEDYMAVTDNPEKKVRLHRKWRYSFVQSDAIRQLFDSYKKIEGMRDKKFLPRSERGLN